METETKFNPEILGIIASLEGWAQSDNLLGYLLLRYFNVSTTLVDSELEDILLSVAIDNGILDKEGKFLIPLLKSESKFKEENLAEDWVDEYCKLFTELGKPSFKTESRKRLQTFVKEHAPVGIDEILGATKLYLYANRGNNPKYITNSHYFIKKKVDGLWVSGLATWLEKYRELHKVTGMSQDEREITRRLQ